jgi:lauroyl/myristoyl acyltransferase
VTGKQHLDAALATGRGVVIAHTHTLLGELFWTWLDHAGIDRGITLLQWAFTKSKEVAEDPKTRAIETARELRSCIELLRKGGLVHAFGDGQDGRDSIKVPVHNRMRPYRVGWATMAVSAKSPVVTAAVALGAGGKMSIMIGPQISDDTPGLTDKQRVEALVRAYAKHHERLWMGRPANVTPYHMKQHIGFPPVE